MLSLPSIDSHYIIDNSSAELLQACPRLYQYTVINRRVPSVPRPALNFGGALHIALDARYKLMGAEAVDPACESIQLALLREFFDKNIPPAMDHRQLELATRFVTTYNKQYKREPFKVKQNKDKRMVEQSFLVPLGVASNGKQILFSGRIDLVIEDSSGLWVMDHKTTWMFGSGFEDDMHVTPQMRGYAWVLKQVLGEAPVGYIVNAMRVRSPSKASQEDPTEACRPDDFMRIQEYISYHELDEWKENMLNIVEELVFHEKRQIFPMHRKSCVVKYGRCPFYTVCVCKADQREGFLTSNAFEDNLWSPLNGGKEGKTAVNNQ